MPALPAAVPAAEAEKLYLTDDKQLVSRHHALSDLLLDSQSNLALIVV